jgi:hypothetical protein
MGTGNWVPLALVLGTMFIFGIVFNLVFAGFGYDSSVPNPESSFGTSPLYIFIEEYLQSDVFDTIDTGINIFGFDISVPVLNVFAIGGQSMKDFMVTQLVIFTYIPLIVIIPFTILFILALIWTGIKLILP